MPNGFYSKHGGYSKQAANSFIVSGSPSNPMLWGGNLNAMVAIIVLGVKLLYCPLLYCSSAGKGLTRDSDLRSSLRATTWCLLIYKLWSARPSVDFATHGFAKVAARGKGINAGESRLFNFMVKGGRGRSTFGRRGRSTL